jgi:hypothetical protein
MSWLSEVTLDRALQVLSLALTLYLAVRVDRHARDLRALAERHARLAEEARYEMTPAQRARIDGSILAVVRGGRAVGAAFFVSPTAALTAARNLELGAPRATHATTVSCARAEGGERLAFDVAALDAELGVAVLVLARGQRASAHFLTVPRDLGAAAHASGLFFVTCGLDAAADARDAAALGVATHTARVVRAHARGLLLDAPTFDGDSGGAVVVARTGVVIALHRELVSAAREGLEQKTGVGERLGAFERSLQSLIRGAACGCVGVRLDCREVRDLLRAAAQ